MQVDIQATAVVVPGKPPFDGDHVLPLSGLDTDRNLHVTLRYLRIYANHNHQQLPDPFQVITAALSAALVYYYPIAGTLRSLSEGGVLQLHCHQGDGVPVVGAVVNCELSSVDDYLDSDAGFRFIDRLAPDPDPNESLTHPMLLQVTRFACGGFVLGAAIHHAICDGLGATLFFHAMAELARGAVQLPIDPIWSRDALLGPRNPARVEFPIQEFLSFDKDFSPYSHSGRRIIKACYLVNEERLDQLKAFLLKQSGLKFTTFEALGAFIWRARTRACKVPGEERVTFAYSINIRKLLNPPLPDGYWGNGCVPMYIHLLAEELVKQPIWRTADWIKKSKHNATEEYVRSFIDFHELHHDKGITAGRRVSGFTDWRHLGHSGVNFGWGGPVAVVPLSRNLLGSTEPCFFLPGNGDGLRVLVHLEEDAMPLFRQEMDRLSNPECDELLSAI